MTPPVHIPSLLAGGVGGGTLFGGLWLYLGQRATALASRRSAEVGAPAVMLTAMAAFQKELNGQAQTMVEELRQHITKLQERVTTLEAENERCRGENAQAMQRVDSLEALLRRNGIDVPNRPRPGCLITLEGDRATVLAPASSDQCPPG